MFIIYDETDGVTVWQFGEDKSLGDISCFDSLESIQAHLSNIDEGNCDILCHELYAYELTPKGQLNIEIKTTLF